MNFLNLIKRIYENPTFNITASGEKVNVPSHGQKYASDGYLLSPFLFDIILGGFSQGNQIKRKEIKGIQIRKEEVKLTSFVDNITIYTEKPNGTYKKSH